MTSLEGSAKAGRRWSMPAVAVAVVVSLALLIAVAVPVLGSVLGSEGGPRSGGSFSATGSMTQPRSTHAAVALLDGRVLVAGGFTTGLVATPTAELYEPASGTFIATGSMSEARTLFTATVLPDGRVLVAGGLGRSYLASAELYDPTTGRFTARGSMKVGRAGHTATLLPDGSVLIAGGMSGNQLDNCLRSAERYDPATGRFEVVGTMGTARYLHSAALLGNGQLLLAAGQCLGGTTGTAEIFDPSTGRFHATGSMGYWHMADDGFALMDGRAVVAGNGWIETFDPASATFSARKMLKARSSGHATLLKTGAILLTGGARNICCDEWEYFPDGEVFTPSTGDLRPAGPMVETRVNSTATLLKDGRVLIAGGESPSAGRGVLASAELFALK